MSAEKNRKLKICVIGAGLFAARFHIPSLLKNENVEISAICRTNPEKAKGFADYYKIPAYYTDYKKMLENEKPDGAVITSPPAYHFEQAMACIERGIPVLLEKPMIIGIDKGFILAKTAREKNVPVVVGYNRHFRNECRKAKEIIDSGKIGKIKMITARWSVDIEWSITGNNPPDDLLKNIYYVKDNKMNFRGIPEQSGGGAFIDAGSHMIEEILWLSGKKPLNVRAMMSSREYCVDSDTVLFSTFEDEVIVSCSLIGTGKAFNGNDLWITGTHGSIFKKDRELFLQINGEQPEKITNLERDYTSTENFIDILMGRAKILCGIEDGLRADIFIKSVYDSAAENGSEKVITQWV